MQPANSVQVGSKRLDERSGEHGHPIFLALRVANDNLPILKVQILDAQAQAFEQAKATAVREHRHQPQRALQLREQRLGFLSREYDGQVLRFLRPLHLVEPR